MTSSVKSINHPRFIPLHPRKLRSILIHCPDATKNRDFDLQRNFSPVLAAAAPQTAHPKSFLTNKQQPH